MSNDNIITDGVIIYDTSQAKPDVDALITAEYKQSADVLVAGVLTLATIKNVNPKIKIAAVALAAQYWDAILDAVYAGHPLPAPGSKPRVVHQTSVAEPQEAPVNPALQELAELIADGNVDQMLEELLDLFRALTGLAPEQRQARLDVARQVINGDLEVDDRGVLKLVTELAETRRQLKKADADKTAAEGRVANAKSEGKREAERDIARRIAEAKAEGKRDAERDIARRLADAKAEGKREAETDVADRLTAAKEEGKREAGRANDTALGNARNAAVAEYRRAHGLSDELLAAIDTVMAADEDVRNARLAGIQAVADGSVDVQYVRETVMPAIANIAQILKYGEGGVTNMGTNRVFQALDRNTQNLLASRRPRRRS